MPAVASNPQKRRGTSVLVILLLPVRFILCILGLVFGLDVYHMFAGEIAMSKIKLPADVTFQSKSWTFGDHFDNPAEWTYTYSANQGRSQLYAAITKSLQDSGYSVDGTDTRYKEDIEAHNDATTLNIQLGPPVPDGPPAAPTPTVSTVSITVLYANMQNVGDTCQKYCLQLR